MSIDARILSALRAGGGTGVSGAELSQSLGVSRAAIWARIEELRSLGYEVVASPHQGYRLLGSPDVLHADDLLSRLGRTRVIGRDIQVFRETGSTNDVVDRLARDGAREGVVVFAQSQSKGRGRRGRKWVSPAGKGLWFSVLLRPNLHPQEVTRLTICSATALRRAIEQQTGLRAEIKWPNDILVAGKKLAGILTELHAELDRVSYLVLGIGVDVNVSPADLPLDVRKSATSLKALLGRQVSLADLAVRILRELDRDYARLNAGEFVAVAEEWEHYCTTIGRRVSLQVGERKLRGRAEALGEDGALLLRTDHGHLERVVGGDVVLER
jgi:BirA family transcriptional regulator, biotin operon repressor / biotin---[acetyl-CoA-carboxylase] ligase